MNRSPQGRPGHALDQVPEIFTGRQLHFAGELLDAVQEKNDARDDGKDELPRDQRKVPKKDCTVQVDKIRC